MPLLVLASIVLLTFVLFIFNTYYPNNRWMNLKLNYIIKKMLALKILMGIWFVGFILLFVFIATILHEIKELDKLLH